MSIDPAQIVDIVLEHLPEIIQKQPEKARKLLDELSKHFATKEEIIAILDRIDKILEEIKKMNRRLNEIEKQIEETNKRIDNLTGRMDRLEGRVGRVEVRLGRIERTLEKLTLDIEEDARLVIKEFLRSYGIEIELSGLLFMDREINVYGSVNDICVIGEASVRAGIAMADRLERNIEYLKTNRPDLIKPKIIKVLYVSMPLLELVDECKKREILLLKSTGPIVFPQKIKDILAKKK